MQPQAPSSLPEGYDFLQSAPVQKKKLINPDSSTKQRVIIAGAGVLILIILATVAMNLLGRGSRANSQLILNILQEQNELIRVAELGTKSAKGRQAQNYSTTVKATLITDQSALLALAKNNGVAGANKFIGAKKNGNTDTLLSQAAQTNKFDEVVIVQLQKQMVVYGKDIKKAKLTVKGKKTVAVLNKSLENAIKLLPKPKSDTPKSSTGTTKTKTTDALDETDPEVPIGEEPQAPDTPTTAPTKTPPAKP